jgi:hypothetical protein
VKPRLADPLDPLRASLADSDKLLHEVADSDLLGMAIADVRPLVADRSRSTKERIHLLWAATKKARSFGADDVVRDAFMALAIETHLIDRHGYWTGTDVRESVRRHGAEDVAHGISWALRGWNPFEKGPLK